jgi:hypothetical protein
MNKIQRITAIAIWLSTIALPATAQQVKRIRDQHIIHQQERMVFKQWERRKFTPRSGFLGLNYQYWLTWAWHPNYPKNDLRPLRATGPQTLRLGLVAAMQQTDGNYKLHADTLRNTYLSEMAGHSGLATVTDPLWQLYYKMEFEELNLPDESLLQRLPHQERAYMLEKGVFEWFSGERADLRERLQAARTTDMERGSRILTYHRILGEYHRLEAVWQSKLRTATLYTRITGTLERADNHRTELGDFRPGRTDREIARDILRRIR